MRKLRLESNGLTGVARNGRWHTNMEADRGKVSQGAIQAFSGGEIRLKAQGLEDINKTVKVLLKKREEDIVSLEEKIHTNVKMFVIPYLDKLKRLNLNEKQMAYVEMIEKTLCDIASPYLWNLSSFMNLTPREAEIAYLIKDGKSSKDIANLLNISITVADFHRKNLRLKLGIRHKKINLRAHLCSLDH